MIRTNSGRFWHYGIYVSDEEIIQFGPNPASARYDPNEIKVMQCGIDEFLCGGFLEVAQLDKKESKSRKSPEDSVDLARARIGEGGYHILYNNCEHFAYECIFGVHKCSQVDSVREMFRSIPLLDVYVAPMVQELSYRPLYPPKRQAEIESVSNERVKAEKYCVWRLLEYAIKRSFGKDITSIEFKRTKEGKWTAKELYFSLSHSHGMVAAAVSRRPVGIDIEALSSLKNTAIYKKILTPDECLEYEKLSDDEKTRFLIHAWTKKESNFKCFGEKHFLPAKITPKNTTNLEIEHGGAEFVLSVCGESIDRMHIYDLKNDTSMLY